MARSPLHHASLVDPALHSAALLELLDIKLSRPVLEYIIDCVVDTVDYAIGRPSSSRRGRALSRRSEHAAFATFVTSVLSRAEVTIPTILVSLVYIDRAKPHLQIALEEWACERVFLGAVMVASKYLNDSTLKNVHWALCTGVFGKRDVGRIEREFLDVINFELSVTEDDILSHHDSLSAVALPSHNHRRHAGPHTRTRYQPANATLPDLDPSSPKSSSSGSSPAPLTPETYVDPTYGTDPKVCHENMDDSATQVAPIPSKQSQPLASTMDLIRAFPLPVSRSHSHLQPSAPSHKPHHRSSHRPYHTTMTQVTA
ncbi:hypothetical protein JVT61DRAFT_2391 [Boletus reticuloceps]|uniref:Cyclin N-terminal domain-containing protein n=1 Tax=Boletus reticuloceps TaxID=495285 RepID=A0A8I2YQS7_9AGAM|nr:hypothetical protein JVT61DRAFT_2391 [Boletus reticuloceps]